MRIDTLCSLLEKTDVFADVGCDHGYCSEYMLKNDLCEKAILSDISKGSLQKAETLLAPYVRSGRAVSVLGDGFFGVDKEVGLVLIAGMGGSEIISILSDKKYGFMPKRFVFQPMHDGEKLRRYILENGGYIDMGIIDTMNDLIVNFIGAVVFSVLGYVYIKNRGKGFAAKFIPKRETADKD